MKPRFIALIAAALLIYTGLNYYIGWHGRIFLKDAVGMEDSAGYWVVFWIAAFSYILARLPSKIIPYPVMVFLKVIGSYWIAALEYALLLLPLADLAAWVLHLAGVPISASVPVLGAVVLIAFLALFLKGSWNAWKPVIRRYEATVAKSAGSIQKLRIAAASDLHLGNIVGNRHLRILIEQMNAMDPDLILLPGDVIDDSIEPFIRYNMAETLKGLKARYGVYAVLGNHEYIGGHVPEFVSRMKEVGIDVLLDRTVKIADSLYLIGRKDKAAERMSPDGRMKLEDLLKEVDPALPLILLDHQPYELGKAEALGIDVMLSGHTHRGQMAPNHWITGRLFELDWGFLKKGSLHAIVSSGYGTWGPPIRIGSRAEIIELTVLFEGSK